MNTIRMLGLVLALASCTAALVGLDEAGATALCSANQSPCAEGKVYAGTNKIIEAKTIGTGSILKNDIANVECASEWEGTWEADLQGEYHSGEVKSLTFTGCTTPTLVGCSMIARNLPYGLSVGASGGGDGNLDFEGPPVLEAKCGAAPVILECTFTVVPVVFEVTGNAVAATAKIKVSIAKEHWTGKICPMKFAEWEAEYEIVTPAPLFLIAAVKAPVFCKATPGPCVAANVLGPGTSLKASLKASSKFIYTVNGKTKEPVCTNGSLEGKTTEEGSPLVGEITAFEFSSCGGGACTPIKSENAPYRFEVNNWINSDDGDFTMLKKTIGPPTIRLACGSIFEECIYGPTTGYFKFNLNGSTPAEIYWPSKVTMKLESGSSLLCGSTATWEGVSSGETNYKVTSPAALYVETEA